MPQDFSREELRIARRQRVLKQGKILLTKNLSIIDCAIRDMSDTGARLVCGDQAAVPNEFRFVTMGDNQMRDARVKWRRGELIGIQFTSEPRRAPPRKW